MICYFTFVCVGTTICRPIILASNPVFLQSEELIPKYKLVSLLKKFNFIWKQHGRTLCAPTICYFTFVCVGTNTVRPIIFASNPVFLQSEELIPKYKLVSLLKKFNFIWKQHGRTMCAPTICYFTFVCVGANIGRPLNS